MHLLVAERAARGIASHSPEKRASHLYAKGEGGRAQTLTYWAQAGRAPYHIGYGVHVLTDRLRVSFYPATFSR